MGAGTSAKERASADDIAAAVKAIGNNFTKYAQVIRDDGLDGQTIAECGVDDVMGELVRKAPRPALTRSSCPRLPAADAHRTVFVTPRT